MIVQNGIITAIFFQLLRYSIGASNKSLPNLSGEMWNGVFKIAQQQALLGVLFYGIQKQSQQKPPRDLLLQWIVAAGQIEERNRLVNRNAVALAIAFKAEGYDCCLLKGQGNNLLYSSVFSRTPGDIDLWITPTDKSLSEKQREKRVITFLRKKYPKGFLHYNHIDAGVYHGTELEVHHRPRFVNNMIHNARLQKWIASKREEQFRNFVRLPETDADISVPTWEFNVVFQLAHIYGHVLQSGIGLRHILDYYFLLKARNSLEFRDKSLESTLRYLGMEKFAGAVMWGLKEVLNMEERYMIVPPDERLGKFLLNEIMLGGNFGQYDARVMHGGSQLCRNIRRLKRDFRLMCYFPSECLWEPVFRLYHFFWRMAHKL